MSGHWKFYEAVYPGVGWFSVWVVRALEGFGGLASERWKGLAVGRPIVGGVWPWKFRALEVRAASGSSGWSGLELVVCMEGFGYGE